MKEKEVQGFSYGKEYDKEKKKHPDMLPYNELKEEVKEYDRTTVRAVLQAQKELQSKYSYNSLKPFDFEAAKAGKPVCTRDGRNVRILCFDAKGDRPIVALIDQKGLSDDYPYKYYTNGSFYDDDTISDIDLMIVQSVKTGYVNLYKDSSNDGNCIYNALSVYSSIEEARNHIINQDKYIDTVEIFWKE